MNILAYLADQNPGNDRSYGISRMSYTILEALHARDGIIVEAISSYGSQSPPPGIRARRSYPWATTSTFPRLLTDHFHPLMLGSRNKPDVFYYPKGYLPLMSSWVSPSVVTVHDTIIQYYCDNYPEWRNGWEYRYWSTLLQHTLKNSDRILTVSEASKSQILQFMDRHKISRREIVVAYEPCVYESVDQPSECPKKDFVIHLASREPHKGTSKLIRWWLEAERNGRDLPILHLIGTLPDEVSHLLTDARTLVKRPFLTEEALEDAYTSARALIFPSEIEGFGLPALEAYYLGTPVCYVKGTSVEEVLSVATIKGGFDLLNSESLFIALDEVTSMTPCEVHTCGLKLRETYAAAKVVDRMIEVFRSVMKS